MLPPLSMCTTIFRFSDLHIYSHTKKSYQGNSNRNWSTLDLYQVHHDIQNTNGFWRWNAQPYFSHENIDSIIVCFLPRWNVVIHAVSPKLEYYWSNWWSIYSASWVSLDCQTTWLELILVKVYSCLEAAFFHISSDLILSILASYVVIIAGLPLTDPNY